MTDVAIGFLLLGVAMLVVLGIVFAISSRGSAPREAPRPPRGVHLPSPSFLPVIMSVGALLLGAGLAFRAEDQFANLWLDGKRPEGASPLLSTRPVGLAIDPPPPAGANGQVELEFQAANMLAQRT